MLASQATLEGGIRLAGAALPVTPRPGAVTAADPRRACFYASSLRTLATQRPGLIAADLDLGPYIVALTPHWVVAAPYHRLHQGILANHAILEASRAQAEASMRGLYRPVQRARRSSPARRSLPTRRLAGQ